MYATHDREMNVVYSSCKDSVGQTSSRGGSYQFLFFQLVLARKPPHNDQSLLYAMQYNTHTAFVERHISKVPTFSGSSTVCVHFTLKLEIEKLV